MVYILTNTKTLLKTEVRPQESQVGDPSAKALLHLKLKQQLSLQSFAEQQEYINSSAIAAYVSLNKLDQRQRYRAGLNLVTQNNQSFNFNKGSTSSGLGYALGLFEAWWSIVLNKTGTFEFPVFATGEILTSGHVKPISHLGNKIDNACDYVTSNPKDFHTFYICYPAQNDDEISQAQRQNVESLGGVLMPVVRLQNALGELLGESYDGDPLGRWSPFKGLNSFDYEDNIRFFGRDIDILRLKSDIEENPGAIVLSGENGSGKSSLIKAGLIPVLEREWGVNYWVYTTPSSINIGLIPFVLEHMAKAWDINDFKTLQSEILNLETNGVEYLKSHINKDSKHFLLFIDQYEECFDIENPIKTSDLNLVEFLSSAIPEFKLFITVQSDYLGQLIDAKHLKSPTITHLPSQLSSYQWQAIISEQASFSNLSFDVDDKGVPLDRIILEEAIHTPLALPMVEYLLEQMYLRESHVTSTSLSYSHYQKIGGLRGATVLLAGSLITRKSEKFHLFFEMFVGIDKNNQPYFKSVDQEQIKLCEEDLTDLLHRFEKAFLIAKVSNKLKIVYPFLLDEWIELKDWIHEAKGYLVWRESIDERFREWEMLTRKKSKTDSSKYKTVNSFNDGRGQFLIDLRTCKNLVGNAEMMYGLLYKQGGLVKDKKVLK
jgi:hypothetical protein